MGRVSNPTHLVQEKCGVQIPASRDCRESESKACCELFEPSKGCPSDTNFFPFLTEGAPARWSKEFFSALSADKLAEGDLALNVDFRSLYTEILETGWRRTPGRSSRASATGSAS